MPRPRMRRGAATAAIAMAMTSLGGVAATGTTGASIPGLWLYATVVHPTHVSAQPSGVPDEMWGDA
jgi:hypothetical protein